MLEVDPTKRITASSALRNPWVSNRDKVAQAVHRQVSFCHLSQKVLRNLMGHVHVKCSVESKLQIIYMSSIEIRLRFRDTNEINL